MSLSPDAHQRLITEAQQPYPQVRADDLSDLLNAYELLKGRESARASRLKQYRVDKKDHY
jgi:hypothetical protein